jgi:hypothetical protein
MGVVLRSNENGSTRPYDDGEAEPPLRATLSDGAAVVMSFLVDELPEYVMNGATISEVFTVDAAGRRVTRPWQR